MIYHAQSLFYFIYFSVSFPMGFRLLKTPSGVDASLIFHVGIDIWVGLDKLLLPCVVLIVFLV